MTETRTLTKPSVTAKQRELLVKLGYVGFLDDLTIDQASDLITQMKAQIDVMTAEAKRRSETMDLIEIASRQVHLVKESSGEYAGPCPKCGGTDRFHVTTTWFFCRQCHPDRGDGIEYTMWTTGKDYLTVCREIAGGFSMSQPTITDAPPRKPVPKKSDAPDDNWLRRAKDAADEAARLLFAESGAEPGQQYLTSRGIEPHCWLKFHLGYRNDVPLPGTWDGQKRILPGRPAIVMPWYRGGQVWGIRYRFLEAHEYVDTKGEWRKEKQVAYPGSHFAGVLYGGHALSDYLTMPGEGRDIQELRTLVICEGELNAISIWQMTEHWNWDVLSLGSESQKLTPSAIDYARKYGRILVWMDKARVVREIMSLLTPIAFGVNSPTVEGKQLDANDMLQRDMLGAFLATARLKACRSEREREKVRWDLWDADQRPPFLDSGARLALEGLSTVS